MPNMKMRILRLAVCGVALVAFGSLGTTLAQPTTRVAPYDNKASPDIYKEVAGNDQYRMVEGIWKPGQRDQFHSHPRMMYYWATDCSVRWHDPDGTSRDFEVKAGAHGTQDAVVSHSLENRGTSECRIVMFEPKLPD
jgi:hypothetical protein